MSTALALYSPQEQIEIARGIFPLAESLAKTDFVPKPYRGKPAEVMACMLKGSELGIGLMQSLSSIHVIEGRPTMSAELMRAVALSRGHDIVIVDSNSTKCTVKGKRAGSDQWNQFSFTVDDAKAAGIAGKDVWRKYPGAMLLARATGLLCRAVFADCLAGISYTLEELNDGEEALLFDPATGEIEQPASGGKARARRGAATRGAAAAPVSDEPPPVEVKPRGEVPLLPGEDDDITDAEIVEDPPAEEVVDRGGPKHNGPQAIAMAMGEHGVSERDDKLAACSHILGFEVQSTKELSVEQASTVLSFLAGLNEGEPFPFEDDDAGSVPSDEVAKPEVPQGVALPSKASEWKKLAIKHKVGFDVLGVKLVELAGEGGSLDTMSVSVGAALYAWITGGGS